MKLLPLPPISPEPIPPLSQDWVLGQDYIQLSTTRPVRLVQHVWSVPFRRHRHTFTELVVVQDGSIPHEIFDENGVCTRFEVETGDCLVIPPGLIHGYAEPEVGRPCHRVDICYLAECFLWDLGLLWAEGLVPLFFAS
ncbi:cupin domain-containing protein, partial [bacterium]